MVRLRFLLLLLAVFPVCQLPAQQSQEVNDADKPLRIEIPAGSPNETYRLLPCGKKGVILFFRSNEVADELNTRWYFTLYDTNFQEAWTKHIPLPNDLDFRLSQSDIDTLSLLFLHGGKSRNQESDFGIVRIQIPGGAMLLNSGKIRQDAEVTAFGICNRHGWIGYNLKGTSGKILHIRLDNGHQRSFDLGQGGLISIKWMQPDAQGTSVTAVVRRQVSRKLFEHYLVKYDTNGMIKNELAIGSRIDERNLANVQCVFTRPGKGLIMGCYGEPGGASGQKDHFADQVTGFFTIPVSDGTIGATNCYNFLELASAPGLLSEKDIMNLKKKALKKNKTLAEYSLDYPVILHPIEVQNEQYILVAELFTPQYHTESYTDFDYYGRPYTNSFSVFDGFRFFNTVIGGFDPTGKLLWDNTIEMRNLVTFDLSPKVVLFPGKDCQVLCYVTDGKIGSKIIRENQVIEKSDFIPIEMMNVDDKLLSESKGRIIYWYQNFFLTCGYQEIKNIARDSDNKRLVYYFSKIRFEE